MTAFRQPVHESEKTITEGMMGLLVYVLLVEKTELWDKDPSGRIARIKDHIQHYIDLEVENKVLLAGPFVDDPERPDGMIVLKVNSEAEARAIADKDVFHMLGYRTYKVRPWLINEGAFNIQVRFSNKQFSFT